VFGVRIKRTGIVSLRSLGREHRGFWFASGLLALALPLELPGSSAALILLLPPPLESLLGARVR
jgi:hypothetical protein